jgi:hypothetical protein
MRTNTSISRGTNANATNVTGENINCTIKLNGRNNATTEWGTKPLRVIYTNAIKHDRILGIDWCKKNNILIKYSNYINNIKNHTTNDNRPIWAVKALAPTETTANMAELEEIKNKIRGLKGFFEETNGLPPRKTYNFAINIVDSPPLQNKSLRQHCEDKEKLVNSYANKMLEMGYIRPAKASYTSPTILVKKEKWRNKGVYRLKKS